MQKVPLSHFQPVARDTVTERCKVFIVSIFGTGVVLQCCGSQYVKLTLPLVQISFKLKSNFTKFINMGFLMVAKGTMTDLKQLHFVFSL